MNSLLAAEGPAGVASWILVLGVFLAPLAFIALDLSQRLIEAVRARGAAKRLAIDWGEFFEATAALLVAVPGALLVVSTVCVGVARLARWPVSHDAVFAASSVPTALFIAVIGSWRNIRAWRIGAWATGALTYLAMTLLLARLAGLGGLRSAVVLAPMLALVIVVVKAALAMADLVPPAPPAPREAALLRRAWARVSRGLVVVCGPPSAPEATLLAVAETCERFVEESARLLEIKRPLYEITVYLSDEQALVNEVCGTTGKGLATAGADWVLAPYSAGPSSQHILAHELCHVLCCGEWPSMSTCVVKEGLAEFVSQRLCGPEAGRGPQVALSLPLRLLAARDVFYEELFSPRGAAACDSYRHAHAFVRYLIASRGLERFKLCCGALEAAATNPIVEFSRAVRDVYGESIEEIEAAWREAEASVEAASAAVPPSSAV